MLLNPNCLIARYNPWCGTPLREPENLDDFRMPGAHSWDVDPMTGHTRGAVERAQDPYMTHTYPRASENITPPETVKAGRPRWSGQDPPQRLPPSPGVAPLTTLAEVRTAKQQLEGDILALIQQFERRTGVGVHMVALEEGIVNRPGEPKLTTGVAGVAVRLEPL